MATILVTLLLVLLAVAGVGGVYLLGRFAQLAERGEGPLAKLVDRQRQAFTAHAETHREAWVAVADDLGLTPRMAKRPGDPTLRMAGPSPHHPGVRVEVSVHAPPGVPPEVWPSAARGAWPRAPGNQQEALQPRVILRVTSGAPLPAGLCVQPETSWTAAQAYFGATDLQTGEPALDARAHIQAEDAAGAQALLADQAVRRALRLALTRGGEFEWTPDQASLDLSIHREIWEHGRFDLQDVPPSLWALADLVAAAAEAQARPWRAAADELGLDRSDRRGRPLLRGDVNGVAVEVVCTGFSTGDVRATLPASAAGIALAADDPGGALAPVRMPSPVLGAALSGRARDPDAATALLSNDALATAAIEVLRGHPGARVTPEGLVLLPRTPVEGVPSAVRDATRLVAAFTAASPTPSRGQRRSTRRDPTE